MSMLHGIVSTAILMRRELHRHASRAPEDPTPADPNPDGPNPDDLTPAHSDEDGWCGRCMK